MEGSGLPSAIERRCCSAEALSVASRLSQDRLCQRTMASLDCSCSLSLLFTVDEELEPELIAKAAENTPFAISLLPRDHSIMAYAL